MVHSWMECYNITGKPEYDDPCDIYIPEYEGSHAMEGLGLSNDKFLKPLKIKKVNIDSPENPKFSNIGDYWDDQIVGKITDLLHEFQDLFPTKFCEMKGNVGNLGEMKIPLNPDAKPIK